MTVRIGTSGWSYPGGRGSWNGIFYPLKRDRSSKFDELAFYAERFNTVEVNSTYYGQPRAAAALGWVKRTPPGFDFSVKLYQKFTHPATAVDRSPVSLSDIDAFRAGIEPLAVSGRLGVLLAQFPSRFKASPESRDYLEWLLSTFSDYPMAIELRHRTWSDEREATAALLNAHGAAWTHIDEPKFRSSIESTFAPAFAPLGLRRGEPAVESFSYMRLHGRNAAQWWEHGPAEDRYNYLYSEDELRPFADVMRQARAAVRKAYLYLNNHFAAQAVADAAMLRDLLDEPVTAPLPAELVSRYPMLEGRAPTLPPVRLL